MQGDVVYLCLVPFRKFCYFSNIIFYRIWGKRNKSEVLHVIFVFISQSKPREMVKMVQNDTCSFCFLWIKFCWKCLAMMFILYLYYFIMSSLNYVPLVPSCLTCLRALRSFVPLCLRALRALIFTCLDFYAPCAPYLLFTRLTRHMKGNFKGRILIWKAILKLQMLFAKDGVIIKTTPESS